LLRSQLVEQMTLPRIATDEEVARVAAFFAGDGSAGMTGESGYVNAGQFCH
jgi:enoyl-[acyl-carrier-protein] reductase (NADH)